MIAANLDISVRTPNGLPLAKFSAALVASGREFVGGSREGSIASGPFHRLPAVFAKHYYKQ